METVTKRLYEGMFLVDSGSNWDEITAKIKALIEKYEGQITDIRKWDERRLAYEIAGKNRGLYILVYFEIPTAMLQEIERDIQLSEDILRAMILRTDQMSEEDLKRETPAMAESRQAAEQREDSDSYDDNADSDDDDDDDSQDSDDQD